MKIITISRQEGSLGEDIAALLAKKLGMNLIARDEAISGWLKEVAEPYQLKLLKESPKAYLSPVREGESFKEYLEKRLREAVDSAPSVILGLGAQLIFEDQPDTLHIRVIASNATRCGRVAEKYGISEKDAENMLSNSDSKHKKYISTLYGKDWSDPFLYHVTINTDRLEAEECADAIIRMISAEGRPFGSGKTDADKKNEADKQAEALKNMAEQQAGLQTGQQERPPVAFKHPAEEEFARILDMYSIEWMYEPHTFPVEWDEEGNVTLAISPDFYLVRFDTYIRSE
ncbi:MAG: cytidylate kinase-like family protein, partial [Clostridiales bacterium]|nr:cytidylate kinase-like family protein [Clostridiales bacterium]